MDVIHFTQGATDPLTSFGASGARFLPLADGSGDTYVSCLHLERGARITAPSIPTPQRSSSSTAASPSSPISTPAFNSPAAWAPYAPTTNPISSNRPPAPLSSSSKRPISSHTPAGYPRPNALLDRRGPATPPSRDSGYAIGPRGGLICMRFPDSGLVYRSEAMDRFSSRIPDSLRL